MRAARARGSPGEGPDAVRFTVRAADGAAVRLYYVVERDTILSHMGRWSIR